MIAPFAHALAVLIGLAASAGAAQADPGLAGEYGGIIWSAGYDLPGTTVLMVGADGRITGRYDYVDGTQPASGTLTGCAFAAPVLRCRWNDAYGSGTLVVRFDPALLAFEGSWYDYSLPKPHDRPEGGYRWTGRRAGG
jgi:hypothetical protein